jgi:ribosomal protein L37AE/L43A
MRYGGPRTFRCDPERELRARIAELERRLESWHQCPRCSGMVRTATGVYGELTCSCGQKLMVHEPIIEWETP